MLLKRHQINGLGICANMLSSTQLSQIAEILYYQFSTPVTCFKNLCTLNAKACENRYGVELHDSLNKVEKFYFKKQISSEPINELEVAGYFASFLLLLEDYLGENTELSKDEKRVLNLVEKMYRIFERKGIYSSKAFKYVKHIIFYHEENSIETIKQLENYYRLLK